MLVNHVHWIVYCKTSGCSAKHNYCYLGIQNTFDAIHHATLTHPFHRAIAFQNSSKSWNR